MADEKIINIEELTQDGHNFNRGTEQGQQLMARSFKEHGAGRSILIDRNGNIIAGNKSQQAAIAAGIKRVRVIETTGDELVAVKRTDVDINSAEGRKMAYLDNLTTQVNLSWDEAELQTVQADVDGFDVSDFGFDIEDLPQVTFPGAGGSGTAEGDDHEGTETSRLSDVKFVDCYYTPTEKPEITLKDCIDLDLFNKKVQVIKESNLSDEMKAVMQLLAYRFIKIDFENVANYYAFNASEEEKRIIERLRCVLVDGAIDGFMEDHMLRVHEHFN